jgi:predicted metal-dependent phosphoesterase TrpH
VDLLLITDHDSFQGSLDARRFAEQHDLAVTIPCGAEVLTDVGDIIVVTPGPIAIEWDHRKLCLEVKERGGWTILPHPYVGHRLDQIDWSNVDYVEVFNARCSQRNNDRALALCRTLQKRPFFGSDAHSIEELFNAYFSVDQWPDVRQLNPICLKHTPKCRIYASQIVKGVKLRRFSDIAKGIGKCVLRCLGGSKPAPDIAKYSENVATLDMGLQLTGENR